MTTKLSGYIWKIILAGVIALLAIFLLFVKGTYAQSPTPTTATPSPDQGLTFPIADLGDCANIGECTTYCEDPVNSSKCVEYAKEKGFYKDDEVHSATDEFWKDAKDDLGCDDLASCLDFCRQDGNFDKCDAYAKGKDLLGGYVQEPDKPQFLEKAKEILGCDSAASCVTFCDNTANEQKCSEFAHQVGLLGGQITVGPGGCTSQGTCQSFCRDPNNFGECSNFVPPDAGKFQGPGGCDSPGACRSYCETNPGECRSYAPGATGVYVPVSCGADNYFGPGGVCTPVEKTQEAGQCAGSGKFWNGTGCSDSPPPGITPSAGGAFYQMRPEMGNCTTPGQCYDWCKDNTGKCAGFDPSGQRPTDHYIPTLYYTPGTEVKFEPKAGYGNCDSPGSCYDWCRENSGKCGGFDSKAPRPTDIYTPGTYYTPPSDYTYFTPPATNFYVTPIYFTPPAGSDYTTPNYYTPGTYYTPNYYTPPAGSNYTTPNYYTPGSNYYTPTGDYPTPTYPTPYYFTPPNWANYTTPSYYTPPPYNTPSYYTPADPNYTTPTYHTPPVYQTPTYYSPLCLECGQYTTPTYYTPPPGYSTPSYPTPSYPSPTGTYQTPSYAYPTPGEPYTSPSGSYSYPSPSYSYPTPGSYPSPSYSYPSPSYGTPSYGTPSYETPSYGTPSYGTPSYETPSYGTPESYPTPGETHGVKTKLNIFQRIFQLLFRR